MIDYKVSSVALMAVLLSACGSDSDSQNGENLDGRNGGDLTTAFYASVQNADENLTEYVVGLSNPVDPSVTISAQGAGSEQAGWNYFYQANDTLFVVGASAPLVTAYKGSSDGLTQLNEVIPDATLSTFHAVDESTLLATNGIWGGASDAHLLYSFNTETGQATNKVNYTIQSQQEQLDSGTISWPTGMAVVDDNLFVSALRFDYEGNASTPDADCAYVSIFAYPLVDDATPLKTISDCRTANIGTHGSSYGLLETDNGDIYTYSAGSLATGFYPVSTKPSGILKIKSGETEFDTEYFFDIKEATGGDIFWFDYVGENTAIAKIVKPTETDAAWSAYATYTHELALINLNAKTITMIEGIPAHRQQWQAPVQVVDGKILLPIDTADENGDFIYEIDISTGNVAKGAPFSANSVKGIHALTY